MAQLILPCTAPSHLHGRRAEHVIKPEDVLLPIVCELDLGVAWMSMVLFGVIPIVTADYTRNQSLPCLRNNGNGRWPMSTDRRYG